MKPAPVKSSFIDSTHYDDKNNILYITFSNGTCTAHKDRITELEAQLKFSSDQWRLELDKKYKLEKQIEDLYKDKQWLKQLVQEMSATMNAGAKEGIFPRRNG